MTMEISAVSRRRAIELIMVGAAITPALATKAGAQALRGAIDSAIDATHEGLSPGSTLDQGAALSHALAKAETEGRALFLPPGVYEVSQVSLPRFTHLLGVPGMSRLVFRGGNSLLSARHADMLRLEGLTLDGAGVPLPEGGALVDVDDVGDLVFLDCSFADSSAAAGKVRNAAGRVENCRISRVGTIGVWLLQSRGMRVRGNSIEDCGDTGILVARDAEGEDGTLVTENRISRIRADSGGTGQNGNGINLDKANGMVVTGNRVDDCAFSAIRCFSSDSISVTDNICTRSGEMALYIEFAFEGAIVSDNLIDGGNGGISFANFMDHGGRLGVCSGNIVRNIRGGPAYPDGNLQIGAGVAAEADVAITGNVIEGAIWGLQLGWGPYLRDVTATGNVIRRTRIGVAASVVEGAGTALVADNLISDAAQGAILGMRWDQIATGELIDGEDPPANLTLFGNKRA
jgi:uncharacterized secreted repeat protein (TIGR03808 family)